MLELCETRAWLEAGGIDDLSRSDWRRVKRLGFSDAQLAYFWGLDEAAVFTARRAAGVDVTYKTVDTCAAEFAARTPYHYGTYEDEDEVEAVDRPAVVILGSGPNRIGQGVEFDYCCVHAAFALSDAGFETVMLNCNPETVSTDYDTSDRLFFEPLTPEDVLAVCRRLQERSTGRGGLAGVIVSLGGQTPLKLARTLEAAGIPVLGTSPDSIDLAEDRERFQRLCEDLGIAQPPGGIAGTPEAARQVAERLGFPVLVRPSYVLGGRAMQIVFDVDSLDDAMAAMATEGSLGREGGLSAERPVLIDRFLEDAIEVDVDALRDATGDVVIGGVMEHIEEAGVHSGDSACAIPPQTLDAATVATIEMHTRALADALDVRGLLNVQYAVKDGQVLILEANPREPHRPVREQGDRRAAREGRVTRDGRRDVGRAARRRSPAPARGRWSHRGEGSGAAVRPLPRRRHHPRARDAIDRRGHGHRPLVRACVREEPDRGAQPPAALGHGAVLARRPRQAVGDGGGAALRRAGLRDRGHRRHRHRARRRGPDRGGGDRAPDRR